MKNLKFKKLALVVICLLFAFSCTSVKVLVNTKNEALKTVSSIGIVTLNFNERSKPVLPLIDAGIYNAASDEIADVQRQEEKKVAVKITDFFADQFGSKLNATPVVINENASQFEYTKLDLAWAQQIAVNNNLDAVIVPMARVVTAGVGIFGINGTNFLSVTVFVVSADGDLLADGYFQSTSKKAGPKNIEAYSEVVNNYSIRGTELINLFFE